MPQHRELLKIGEFARLGNTSLRTLRYYDELGLLQPAERGPGGVRYYIRSQLDRIVAVKRLQRLGLSLEWMANTLFPREKPHSGHELVQHLRAALRQQIVLTKLRIESHREELQELEDSYRRLDKSCASCGVPFSGDHCDPCPGDAEPLAGVIRALL